jgi:hypothetical protein
MKTLELGNGEKWGIFGELSLAGKVWGMGKVPLYRGYFPFSLPQCDFSLNWGKLQ